MPIFFYGTLSVFSGTQIYNNYLYQTYNILYTGMPILWYAVFDWQFPKETLLENPKHYRLGLQNRCFHPVLFWSWYFMATVQGGLLLYLTFWTLDDSNGSQLEILSDGNQQSKVISGDLTLDGLFIFEAIVFLVNIKIMFQTYKYTFYSFFWQIGSILNFFIIFTILNYMESGSLYQMMPKLFSFKNSYFLLFFIVSSYVLVEFGISVVDDLIQEHLD